MDDNAADRDLIRAFRAGEAGALSGLIEKYRGPVFAYLLRLCRDRTAAEDLFQEVFLKVVRNLSSYRERDRFSAWIFTLARNAVMDRFRSVSRRREDSLDAAAGDGRPLGDALPSPEPGPEAALEKAEESGAIQAAFERLSPEQREVFVLRHYSGLSFREIAGISGVPIGTVLARMSRALARMRRELGDRAENGGAGEAAPGGGPDNRPQKAGPAA